MNWIIYARSAQLARVEVVKYVQRKFEWTNGKHPRPETTVEIEEENNFSNSPQIYLLILHQRILATLSHPFPNSENRMVKKYIITGMKIT